MGALPECIIETSSGIALPEVAPCCPPPRDTTKSHCLYVPSHCAQKGHPDVLWRAVMDK